MATTTFDYKVRDRNGRLVSGQLEGDNLALVAAKLRDMGFAPVEIKPVKGMNLKAEINIPGSERPGQAEGSRPHEPAARHDGGGRPHARARTRGPRPTRSSPSRSAKP